MKACYFASDFLVHPTFYDPCSLVVLEALACGLPVITSRYNGASELLDPPRDSYVLADPHDDALLAVCMRQLLDPERRSACARAVGQTAARWTFEDHYRQMLQVFAEAAARRRGGAAGVVPPRKNGGQGSGVRGQEEEGADPLTLTPDPLARGGRT
jgi:UDP-glucose:(heptosyl)LPS alpha-1,3-glucosyltransferase